MISVFNSKKGKQQTGFTLIELLIVMLIMLLSVGLVGGMAIDSADKAKAYSEQLELESIIENLAQKAFFDSKEMDLSFNEHELKVSMNDEVKFEVVFKYLTFDNQHVTLSAHGFANKAKIDYLRNSIDQELSFPHMLFLSEGILE